MISNSKIKMLMLVVFLIALIVGFFAGMLGASIYNNFIAEQPIVEIDKL